MKTNSSDSSMAKPEERESLWLLVAAPTMWAAHLLASYLTAAVWCAKLGSTSSTLDMVRICIAIYTGIALLGIACVGRLGMHRHRSRLASGVPHDRATAEDRHSFLGFATLLLALLSAVAVIYVALVVVFVRSGD